MTATCLVHFNASYYRYPRSVWRGYWGRYPLDTGLAEKDLDHRARWLETATEYANSEFHAVVSRGFGELFDSGLMHALLELHGVYVHRFFHNSIRESVARRCAQLKLDPQDVQRLVSSAWGHEIHIYRQSNATYRIADHISEQTLIRAISAPPIHRTLELWFADFNEPRICELCGNIFRVTDLPDWLYFRASGPKSCCFECPIVESPRKSQLGNLIPAFVEQCGFIPNADAGPMSYAFTSRLSSTQWPDVFVAYAKMGGVEHVKRKYGSWFKALAETGALPDGVQVLSRGIRCLSKDGHVCRSLAEQRIDDWLYARDLAHEREPYYPAHHRYNMNGRRRADWKVGDTFIEYFGLVGNEAYDKKLDEKILLAQECGIDLLAVYPSDLPALELRLGHLLT